MALVAAAVVASRGRLDIVLVLVLAWSGAILGGVVGWVIGLKGGRPLVLGPGPLRRARRRALAAGERVFARHSLLAVYVAPAWMAGVNRMRRAPRAPDAGARQARGLVRRDPPAHRLRAEQRRQRGRDRRLGLPQFNPISLEDHLANGRPWDLDRTLGGLLLLHPRQGHDERTGFQRGTADGLWRFAPLIREFGPAALVVVGADAAYAHDYGALVEEHVAHDADVTLVTTRVAPEDAGRYGVVEVEGGRVSAYAHKPDDPAGDAVANEVFVFTPGAVLDTLEELAGEAGEEGLEDLGTALLPRLAAEGRVREHRFGGYWRDVGTVAAYWQAHSDLLVEVPPLDLDDPDWPIATRATSHRASAQISRGAKLEESRLAPGSRVAGSVERSVIGRGARVEEGAVVRDSVLLPAPWSAPAPGWSGRSSTTGRGRPRRAGRGGGRRHRPRGPVRTPWSPGPSCPAARASPRWRNEGAQL